MADDDVTDEPPVPEPRRSSAEEGRDQAPVAAPGDAGAGAGRARSNPGPALADQPEVPSPQQPAHDHTLDHDHDPDHDREPEHAPGHGEHGHEHAHDHSHADLPTAPEVHRALLVVVAMVVVATVVGFFAWQGSGGFELPEAFGDQGERVEATVIGDAPEGCDAAVELSCVSIRFEVTSGANAGTVGDYQLYLEAEQRVPQPEVGDEIVVLETTAPSFDPATGQLGPDEVSYRFADFQRTTPLLVLAGLFVFAVVALGRFQGVRALAGLVLSGVVLLGFVFPAILDGQPPLGVAMVGASAIAISTLYLTHGFNDTTTVALLGTLGALGLTGALGALFSNAAQLTGLVDDNQRLLAASADAVDIRGLILAGIILGSLGVLDDVTVTQVSAVARLREANPSYGVTKLYATGVAIGRDHIASTVNTLVLAYAGAALPLLLFYTNIGIGLGDSVTSEIVATEVVRTLVGSIGLVAAVPLTTFVAAVVVTGTGLRRPTSTGNPQV